MAEPYRFEFFQAVRLLERLYPGRHPVGHYGPPGQEVVRFRAHASLSFPPSEVHDLGSFEITEQSLATLKSDGVPGDVLENLRRLTNQEVKGSERFLARLKTVIGDEQTVRFKSIILKHAYAKPADDGPPPEMIVAVMGLTGPLGVLPHPYSEQVIECARAWQKFLREREPQEDLPQEHPLVDFLDIFNHRLISLFYRAWEKYRFPLGYERGGKDAFTRCLFALVGLGTRGLRGRLSFPDDSLLAYGGLLAQRPRSASALAGGLGDYFDVPVRVEQFVPRRLKLDAGSVTRLGRANSNLGVDVVIGTEVWECQSKFRFVFGPLGLKEFMAFLPAARFFIITDQSLASLKAEGVPGEVLEKLQRMKDRAVKGKEQFRALLKTSIGDEQTAKFESLISRHAFLRVGTAFHPAVELTRMLVGKEFDFQIQPLLKAAEVPSTVLTTRGSYRPMLGWNTWLKTQPMTRDADQVVLAGKLNERAVKETTAGGSRQNAA